jgi:predicted ATPase
MSNLLSEVPTFVGRQGELADAQRWLSEARLLTLKGVGGVGKTCLASHVASAVQRVFPDGVCFVDLAALQDGALVPQTVAAALDLRDQSARPCMERLERHLCGKHLLLVLDNCEHLHDACAVLVNRLLRAAPYLRIMATSRRPLNVSGEQVLEVAPLPVPGEVISAEGSLLQYEAVRLFVDRAAATTPGFSITKDNRAALARLCRRLDGIPLALELAAVRLRALSIEQILERFDSHRNLATGGNPAGRIRRHQTLRATIDLSHDLCSDEERILWRRLSVFTGGFDLAAAEQACSGGSVARDDVYFLVVGLLDQSLLRREAGSGPARYLMLDTVREYGRERLVEAGEEPAIRKRHAAYYHELALRVRPEYSGSRQVEWLSRMRRDSANLLLALDYSLTSPGHTRAALEIASAVSENWIFHGRLGDARHLLDRALQQEHEPSTARTQGFLVAAWIAVMQGDTADAAYLLDECRAQTMQMEDNGALARVSGVLKFFQGELDESIAVLEQALVRCRSGAEDPNNAFLALLFRTASAAFIGDRRAGPFSAECLEMAEAAGAEWWGAWSLWAAGLERWSQGHMSAATDFLQDALRRLHALEDRWGPVWCLEALAWVAASDDRYESAAYLLGAADMCWQSLGVSLAGVRPMAAAHESCEARVRCALSPYAFSAAFERGKRCTFDETVLYVLELRGGKRPVSNRRTGEIVLG